MNIELAERRKLLIATLRAGTYPKGTGSLCVREEEFNDTINEYEYCTTGYCCVGVALKIATTRTDSDMAVDEPSDYERFEEIYGVSTSMKDYLISMNDGDPRPGWTKRSGTIFRGKRSHVFIARFLEIVWALEEQAA